MAQMATAVATVGLRTTAAAIISKATSIPPAASKLAGSSSTTTTTSPQSFIDLARNLHPRLARFFKRYPPGTHTDPVLNPFTVTFNPITKKWQDPIYSLRRQAEIHKLARESGIEELLPPSLKSMEAREAKIAEGKKMKRMMKPKGHVWERGAKAKIEKRKQAMIDMPKLIVEWKKSGHGKTWKKWPK